MTEEIIIDGVNVAGCGYYEPKNDTGEWCDLTCTRDNAPVFRCEDMPNCYFKQLKRLQETLKHTENGRKEKANKLKRIEEIVTHCIQGGFTDEFVQEIFDICREYEEV